VVNLKSYSLNLFARVFIAIGLALFRDIFYLIFTPLTLHWSYLFFKLFVPEVVLMGYKLITTTNTFTFIPACTAASAYLLLALLILLTKDIAWMRRVEMFVVGSLAILGFNLLRIELLLWFFFKFSGVYPVMHLVFWKFLSTIFVFILWIALTKLFEIKSIPIYSDFKYILGKMKR